MNKLTLNNFSKIREIEIDMCDVSYMQNNYIAATPASNSSMSNSVNITLTENIKDDDLLIKDALDMLLDKQTKTETIKNDPYQYDIYPYYSKKYIDFGLGVNEFEFRLFKSNLLVLSNLVVQDSRYGYPDTLILPEKFKSYDFGEFTNVFWTNHLIHDIIILKTSNESEPTLSYIHNNEKYSLDFIGSYESCYNVMHTKSLSQERTDKIQRLII